MFNSSFKAAGLVIVILVFQNCSSYENSDFQSSFPTNTFRTWIGPEYWANPLQDWQLINDRIECNVSGGDRNVVILTHEIIKQDGNFELSSRFGKIDAGQKLKGEGWVGFKIGIRGEFSDYRDSAVRGEGFPLGIDTERRLFIGVMDSTVRPADFSFEGGRLHLRGDINNNSVRLNLKLFNDEGVLLSSIERDSIDPDWISGMIAIVSHSGNILEEINGRRDSHYPTWGFKTGTGRQGNIRFWFKSVNLNGNVVKKYPERLFGPILFSQYTLSRGVLKLTVQLPPVGNDDGKVVEMQIKVNGNWNTIAQESIDELSRTSTFRIEDWEFRTDVPYRLAYQIKHDNDELKTFYREGIIRKEPQNKNEIKVAGFTGNNDLGFPNNELVRAVEYHNPDVLFFSGDQIYEGVGGYGTQTDNLEKITLDYLRKWYLYGWAYGNLLRDRPSISIPDDHDVYHGNIWGAGGKATPRYLAGADAQDQGGYKYFPEWVNMVQRTQTSHLPDPYDPASVKQGIGVYYTDIYYGGLSFAVIEDRKFKSPPKLLLPSAKVYNGWAQNKNFDAEVEGDVAGAELLGERQLKFLNDWAEDWSNGTWMKVVLSQTIFANVATLPAEHKNSDAIVPKLKIFKEGEYPENDIPVQDMDSNGWPQTARNNALKIIRKAFAFHLAGDQHLGSTIQYGVEDWDDAGYAFCVPAISNVWPRRWFPKYEGRDRNEETPKYTGKFKDGFGNKITVHAVSNPYYSGKEPSKLYDRATGYGIVSFFRDSRDIKIECWPRWVDPSGENAKQYPGWPITINQTENFNKQPIGYLPELVIRNYSDPVVQVINQDIKEIIYTKRIKGNRFTPPVFEPGNYTIKIGELNTKKVKVLNNIKFDKKYESKIDVVF